MILSSVSSSRNTTGEAGVAPLPSGLEQEVTENVEPKSVSQESAETATTEAVSEAPPTVAETVAA